MPFERTLPKILAFPSDAPPLTQQEQHAITSLVFGDVCKTKLPLPRKISTIFCFSAPFDCDHQASVLRNIFNNIQQEIGQVVFTGGRDSVFYGDEPDLGHPQSVALWQEVGCVPKPVKIAIETVSTNTKENAIHGWQSMRTTMEAGDVVAISARSFHMGRCVMTFLGEAKQHGWEGTLVHLPHKSFSTDPDSERVEMARDTWINHPATVGTVLGELVRIHKYKVTNQGLFLSDDDNERLERASRVLKLFSFS